MPRPEAVGEVLTQRQLMEFGRASFENAVSLERDARLLFNHGRYARSAALAVIGCEEAGKALLLILAGLGRFKSGSVSSLLKAIRFGRASHQTKHAMALPMAAIGASMPELRRLLAKVARKLDSVGLPDRIEDLPRVIHSAIGDEATEWVVAFAAEWEAMLKKLPAVAEGGWQRDRDAGLYVDSYHGRMETPKRISRRIARSHLDRLIDSLYGLELVVPATDLSEAQVAALSPVLPSMDNVETVERLWREVVVAHKAKQGIRKGRTGAHSKRPKATRKAPEKG